MVPILSAAKSGFSFSVGCGLIAGAIGHFIFGIEWPRAALIGVVVFAAIMLLGIVAIRSMIILGPHKPDEK